MSTVKIAKRLERFGAPTVWEEFSPLAAKTGAINLGQGFPNWESPRFVKEAINKAVNENFNQYCRSAGHLPLVQQLAKRYTVELGRPINPETEVTIGVGASECLFALMQSFVNPGDEVVLISPAFDIYIAQVQMAGGTCKFVPLRLVPDPQDSSKQVWHLDMEELRSAFSERTSVLLLNTPQNPTGKIFSPEELEQIASIARDFPRCVVVSDEVYEHMIYPGYRHTRIATLPGMWDRSVTVSSAGKTFSCTGWKIGWVVGPQHLVSAVITTNQWVQFSVSTPAQQAVAWALERAEQPYEGLPSYYAWLRSEYIRKRDILMAALASAGLKPVAPQGGFFIIADTSNIDVPSKHLAEPTPASGSPMSRDWGMCRFLTLDIGVAAIPPSAFYEEKDKHLAANMARFAFCKEDGSLYEAAARLQGLRKYLRDPTVIPTLPPMPTPPATGHPQ